MKKLLTLSLAIATSVAAMADPIDPVKAESIAQEYLVPGHTMTLVTCAQRSPAKARRLSASVASTSPYYIYSRGANQGFVIVSGDDCLPEVLGYTEQGDFAPDDMPPALRDMLDYYACAIEDAQVNGTNASSKEAESKRRAASTRVNIAPFVTSHWHQSSPYNDMCPRLTSNGSKAATGCVATAASQILYYWRKDLPNTLQGTTPTYGYGDAPVTQSVPKGTPLKWELMRDQYGSEPSEYKEAVAEFVFATGAATWLTYGSSTSGNIEKIPATFSGYFGMNGGWVAYRSSYSQDNWTQLIYDELINGRPVMYTGVHPTNGGHAVFIHGYQASTDKFYFNFGWGAGNGYDGYYTTAETDGMNGFNDYQSALIGAYPKKWNLAVSIKAPEHVYANVDNTFKVTIDNNSTLDFSGFYIFASTTKAKPTKLSDAKSSNTETEIAVDTKQTISLTAKPTSVNTWYITVTDENLNVLAQIPVEVESAESRLTAKSMRVSGLLDKEAIAGNDYTVVYSSKATVNATIANSAQTAFGGTAKLDIYSSEDGGQTFTYLKTISKSGAVVMADGESDVEFNVTSIDANLLYKAVVNEDWGTYSLATKVDVSQLAPVYFKITGKTGLSASLVDNELVFHGIWDAGIYSTLVTRSNNKSAVNYDLTDVSGVSEIPQVQYPNANALIYAPAGATGTNVVTADGHCDNLSLVVNAPFGPRAPFVAKRATVTLDDNYGNWNLITVPFDCTVPDGMQARRIDSHRTTTSGISNATTDVTTLEGGHTYLLITSGRDMLTASSEDVNVVSAPVDNADASVVGTYMTVSVPAGGKLVTVNADGKPYFTKASTGAEAGGLTGYFYDAKMTSTDFRAYSSVIIDPAYMNLADAISQLHDIYEDNSDAVNADANALVLDNIADAERKFTA